MLEMENYPWAAGRSEAVDPLLIIQITAVDGSGPRDRVPQESSSRLESSERVFRV